MRVQSASENTISKAHQQRPQARSSGEILCVTSIPWPASLLLYRRERRRKVRESGKKVLLGD